MRLNIWLKSFDDSGCLAVILGSSEEFHVSPDVTVRAVSAHVCLLRSQIEPVAALMNAVASGAHMLLPYRSRPIPHIIPGREPITPICPECDRIWVEKQQDDMRLESLRRKQGSLSNQIGKTGIPDRFKSKSLTDFQTESSSMAYAKEVATRYCETIQDRIQSGDSLIFCGQP
ncbi:MAG: hypothetical protein HQL63_00745, partial [Magnetococcales bacterium]|nr:hypothetical protein [Magnetococcales bacterium]